MVSLCATYLFSAQLFNLDGTITAVIAVIALLVSLVWFCIWYKKETKKQE